MANHNTAFTIESGINGAANNPNGNSDGLSTIDPRLLSLPVQPGDRNVSFLNSLQRDNGNASMSGRQLQGTGYHPFFANSAYLIGGTANSNTVQPTSEFTMPISNTIGTGYDPTFANSAFGGMANHINTTQHAGASAMTGTNVPGTNPFPAVSNHGYHAGEFASSQGTTMSVSSFTFHKSSMRNIGNLSFTNQYMQDVLGSCSSQSTSNNGKKPADRPPNKRKQAEARRRSDKRRKAAEDFPGLSRFSGNGDLTYLEKLSGKLQVSVGIEKPRIEKGFNYYLNTFDEAVDISPAVQSTDGLDFAPDPEWPLVGFTDFLTFEEWYYVLGVDYMDVHAEFFAENEKFFEDQKKIFAELVEFNKTMKTMRDN